MSDIVELFTAGIVLVVGFAIVSVIVSVNPALVTDLVSASVKLLLILLVIAVFGSIIFGIARGN